MYNNYYKDLEKATKAATVKTCISVNNAKMGGIPSFSLPPVATCCNCSECKKDCYAVNMCKIKKNLLQSWANNLKAFQNNIEYVKASIIKNACISSYFRYFVGGDIVNRDFLNMMIEIANICKNCRFLAFTKNYKIINEYITAVGNLPQNLIIIFSEWNDQEMQNPHNLPTSKVIKNINDLPPAGLLCGGDCSNCICRGVGCWQLSNGQTIHFLKH